MKKTTALLLLMLCPALLFAQHKMESKTKVIAHRGAWKNAKVPPNSIASLKEAIKIKCYGSEFDVHMSADSILYVNHDHDVEGVNIEKTLAKDLDKIKLSNGESLPTLENYLKAGKKQKKTRLILEIKASKISKERSLALARKCVETVQSAKVVGITDYISFDLDICMLVKQLAPKAEVSYLNGEKSPDEIKELGLSGVDYHYNVFKKNENWIKEFNQKGLVTNAWTVNDKETMMRLMEQSINYITTDEPELLQTLLK